jgi:hypothetical protein
MDAPQTTQRRHVDDGACVHQDVPDSAPSSHAEPINAAAK